MNKKAFTLIELLAVIVIIGVVMTIAVPAYTNYIVGAREDAFVVLAKSYVDSVSTSITNGDYKAPVSNNDVTVINLNMIPLHKGGYISPYGVDWVDNKSYVAVINIGSETEPKYEYYFAAQDVDRNAIPLTKIKNINKKTITHEARNTMEVTVQSLAGSFDGVTKEKSFISGLENAITNSGEVLDWNVTTYSK